MSDARIRPFPSAGLPGPPGAQPGDLPAWSLKAGVPLTRARASGRGRAPMGQPM